MPCPALPTARKDMLSHAVLFLLGLVSTLVRPMLVKDELQPLAVSRRRTVKSTGAPGWTMAGFNLASGRGTYWIIIVRLTKGSFNQLNNAKSLPTLSESRRVCR